MGVTTSVSLTASVRGPIYTLGNVQVASVGLGGISVAASQRHIHTQATAITMWMVTHNLGPNPDIKVIGDDGVEHHPLSTSTVTSTAAILKFAVPVAGIAVFSI